MADTLDRIRKLLAKAERAGTEAEARVYTAKAAELSARHGVDAALLAAARPGADPVGCTRVELCEPYSGGKARLLGWTASALRCRWVLHPAGRGRVRAVTVVGHAVDRDRVGLLYESLVVQATRELARCRPPDPGESVAAYRRSWLLGFAARVHERLLAAERSAVARAAAGPAPGGRTAALVLADRGAAVDRAFAAAFPDLGTARRPRRSGSGFGAGVLAGSRADLGRGRLAAEPR
ncbi:MULTISPECIES: DUF2786 domain-containing protein [Pseudonocardia]|jgi:hypothetical protein|uniref:Uncharacterized protein n=1 Tax=Pseudonocardia dioxanivorans (strain ATCC 55486 / DSM 44775 / JCM 13855 / CB1190) TaxID=675635 RepID=F4CYH3_PSEUX|nr:DUF2786 domain-containing protein [Pseudonocardia dioxanivorans]AEA25613.1 hypothetical protein Psed_3424 [Pseudonocardia dioxanivorans CB1190]GJF04876.1 hypothetical protein PSD17_38290 [Pseudonocardia sp. D17]